MTDAADGGEPVLRAPGRLRLRGAQAPLDVVPARRGPGRPVRQGEEADPAHRGSRRLRADQLRARRRRRRSTSSCCRSCSRGRVRAVVELASFSPFSVTHQAFLDSLTGEHRPRPQHDRGQHAHREPAQAVAVAGRGAARRSRRSCASPTRTSAGRPALLAEQNIEAEQKNQEVEQSKRLVEEKAGQLAVSSKYKSEFIANMSHELRTPLNSLLILAEQLEDNPEHNMTDTQVEYASVIRASGQRPARAAQQHPRPGQGRVGHRRPSSMADVSLDELRDALLREFEHGRRRPRASSYSIDIAPDCPDDDRHRPAAPPPDPQEPARQRVQVHRARRACSVQIGLADDGWSREAAVARPGAVGRRVLGHATPASASTTSSSSGSSRRSPRATARPPASTAAPASACRSAASWSACSAARSP